MTQSTMALVHEVAKEGKASVPDCKEQLISVKPGYMLGGYIPNVSPKVLEKRCLKEPAEYERRLQRKYNELQVCSVY